MVRCLMTVIRLTTLVLVGALLSSGLLLATSERAILLTGVVTDARGAVVRDAKVSVSGGDMEHTVLTAADGSYEATLTSSATYTVVVRKDGFCPIRRPALGAQSSPLRLNFVLIVCPTVNVAISDIRDVSNEDLKATRPFEEETLPVGKVPSDFDMLVRFGARESIAHNIRYSAITKATEVPFVPVFVAYNTFTIYAREVTIDKRKGLMTANGDVQLDDGTTVSRGTYLIISFNDGKGQVHQFH
jgi:hypothetical protein